MQNEKEQGWVRFVLGRAQGPNNESPRPLRLTLSSSVAWVNKTFAGNCIPGAQLWVEGLAPSRTRLLGGGHDNELPTKAQRFKTRVGKGVRVGVGMGETR